MTIHRIITYLVATILVLQPFLASAGSTPRLIPQGSVTLLESGTIVDKEIPAPAGMLMACTGTCYVEANGLQLIGADKTVFSLHEENTRFSVMVMEGTVEFSLQADAKPLSFKTPFHDTDTKPYLIPASSDTVFRGALHVTQERAVLTMTQGSLKLISTEGQKLVHAGNSIIMARPSGADSDSFATPPRESNPDEGLIGILAGTATVGILAAAIAAAAGGGGSGGGGGGDDEGEPKEKSPYIP